MILRVFGFGVVVADGGMVAATDNWNCQLESITLTSKVIACLDVRANDKGDLVVTKGDQYDVREQTEENQVRNLGKPVELAGPYYMDEADEELQSAENQTGDNREIKRAWDMVGDGFPFPFPGHRIIKNGLIDSNGRQYSCLEVASEYFRSAADKISIGSDAVLAAEEYLRTGVSIHLPTCFALHQADSSERATMKEVTRILGALLPPPQLTKKQTSPSPEKSVDYSQFLIDKGLHRL